MRTYLPEAAQKNDNLFPQETTKMVLENLPIDYIEGSHESRRVMRKHLTAENWTIFKVKDVSTSGLRLTDRTWLFWSEMFDQWTVNRKWTRPWVLYTTYIFYNISGFNFIFMVYKNERWFPSFYSPLQVYSSWLSSQPSLFFLIFQ